MARSRWSKYFFVLIISLWHTQVRGDYCAFLDGGHSYDLSPLRKLNGGSYETSGGDGEGFYFFNICGEVEQGGCTPHQAVCQVGDAPHGCGSARDFHLETVSDNEGDGVRLVYQSGEGCQAKGAGRTATITLYCDPNATTPRFGFARETQTCDYAIDGYSSHACPLPPTPQSNPKTSIFVVVHSHDDVGWLKTMQGYFSPQVHNIISQILLSLKDHAHRKFIQVEQAFFAMWWEQAGQEERDLATRLISNGQISFVIGGWVMPDEATPSYGSLIDQLTEGHQLVKQLFNVTPTVGWQIDPFGASSVLAEIYKFSGFKGHVIDRINFRMKNHWQTSKSLQFSWKFSNFTDDQILTHILDTNYCYPFMTGLKFTNSISEDDVVRKANLLVDIARAKSRWTRTENILIPLGCDFSYDDGAIFQYEALDRIMAYVTNHSTEMNVTRIQYSDLSDYFDALHASKKRDHTIFPSYQGDFFPYNDKDNSWWTGYYSSRPALKGLIRKSEAVLRASESLYSSIRIFNATYKNATFNAQIDQLLQAVSVNLHHDAITGTEKPEVADDYTRMLEEELPSNGNVISSTLDMLSAKSKHEPTLVFGDNLNKLEGSSLMPVIVYNSLSWTRHDYVKIFLPDLEKKIGYVVVDSNETVVKSQIVTNYLDTNRNALLFKVVLPPMGFHTYFIKITADATSTNDTIPTNSTLSNKHINVYFSKNTTAEVSLGSDPSSIQFQQSFMLYESYTGDNQQSGAYIFRPNGDPYPLSSSNHTINASWAHGDLLSEMYQVFESSDISQSFVKQHVRIFQDDDEYLGHFVELSQKLGPIPSLGSGRELITRFASSLLSNNISYTDNNGFRFLQRTYDPNMLLPIPGNYFPTVYASYIKDETTAIGFVFDRAHGFSSSYGNVDVMLHRRCQHDDGRGVSAALDDSSIIDPVIRVVFGSHSETLKLMYRHIYLLNFPPIVTFGVANSVAEWKNEHKTEYSVLTRDMPPNIHILTLKSLDNENKFMLRLVHLFDEGEHEELSLPVDLPVGDIFAYPSCIAKLTETSLTANQELRSINLIKFNATITLKPKEMRTFVFEFGSEIDECANGNHTCANGKCVNVPCGYICECNSGYEYHSLTHSCKEILDEVFPPDESEIDYTDIIGALTDQKKFMKSIPLIVLSYLTFVCAYSMRTQIKVLETASSRNRRRRKPDHEPKLKPRYRRFMRANTRLMERTFFPQSLRHED